MRTRKYNVAGVLLLATAVSLLSLSHNRLLPIIILPTVHAFAASKKKNSGKNKNSASSTNRGFGAPPPTLDEVVATFRTRLPEGDPNTIPCPCGVTAGASYADCCQPYHTTTDTNNSARKSCTTPLRVLQTRYSAFCYRLPKPLIETTHPKCREYQSDKIAWAKSLNKDGGMFDSFDFVKLEVQSIEETETEHVAYIDFTVTLRGRSDSGVALQSAAAAVAGQETTVHERSQFLRSPDDGGVWRYSGGDVRSQVQGLEDTQLNV